MSREGGRILPAVPGDGCPERERYRDPMKDPGIAAFPAVRGGRAAHSTFSVYRFAPVTTYVPAAQSYSISPTSSTLSSRTMKRLV